eukprot:CAMPEP_0179473372 /NCGR_PEP_ID=MMETSP0799-20121207/53113_1 /TAXON_ID=46947 /ORGANISM="Geminigera cryophila, Strain CCMP2564" /LENGTH=48 /DNA_ID= /DNA_START= /DNA_END= /DNA_ORIENTATION=
MTQPTDPKGAESQRLAVWCHGPRVDACEVARSNGQVAGDEGGVADGAE